MLKFSTKTQLKIIIASFLLVFFALKHSDVFAYNAKNITLSEFTKWVSDQTQTNIIYSTDEEIRTDIYLSDYDNQTVLAMFKAVMASRGLNVVFVDGYYVVTSPSDSQNLNDILPKTYATYHLQNTLNTQISDVLSAIFDNDLAVREDEINAINYSTHDNTVHVSGVQSFVDNVLETVQRLDVDTPTYLVRALVFETEYTESKRVGFDFSALASNLGLILNSANVIDGSSLTYKTNSVDAIFSAIASDTRNRIVSTPSIVVENAQTGYFTVGQTVPFLSTTTNTDEGVTQSIQREDVGISLRITPAYINPNTTRFSISQSVSSISDSAIATDIVTNQRLLSTVVDLGQSQVLHLGGLITDRREQKNSGVPFWKAKRLPTFKSKTTTQTETNIVLTYTAI